MQVRMLATPYKAFLATISYLSTAKVYAKKRNNHLGRLFEAKDGVGHRRRRHLLSYTYVSVARHSLSVAISNAIITAQYRKI